MARSTAKPPKHKILPPASNEPALPYQVAEIYETIALQRYGVVLVLAVTATPTVRAEIVQVSGNVADYLGRSPEQLLGELLQNCVVESDWRSLQALFHPAAVWVNPLCLHLQVAALPPQPFEAILHYVERDRLWVLELEPLPAAAPNLSIQAQDCFARLRSAMVQLERSAHRAAFLQQAAQLVQSLIGFDRVMIYQFDDSGAGQVIAEVKPDDRPSYLHQWFPATDIPAVVRDFYQHNGLRYVPDLSQAATTLEPPLPPQTQAPIDLTAVEMRGVTQCCIDFHRNMGVEALLVVPLVQHQRLWGLISCHHYQPRRLRYELRFASRMLGQFIVSELANYLSEATLADVVQRQQIQTQLLGQIARSPDLATVIAAHQDLLLDVVKAQGAAVFLGDELRLIGETPDRAAVEGLMHWAETTHQPSLCPTDCLSRLYPAAQDWMACASGALILQIAPPRYSIIWFRPEVLQTIDWAGDPTALQVGLAALDERRGPRASFASWQETVRGTALPWQPIELEYAEEIRSAIVGIMLQKAAELAQLNLELQRSNQELEAFAYAASHDLKEPLRGIYNSVTFLIEDYEAVLDEAGVDRLRNLMRLSHRMDGLIDVLLKFSRIGQSELQVEPTDLQAMVVQELAVVQASQPTVCPQIRVVRSLPTIACDPTLTQEVWRNLISNAFKYNDKSEPWIEVGYYDQADQAGLPSEFGPWVGHTPVFFLRDNGIGIRDRHVDSVFRLFKRLHPQSMYGGGTGAGLTIVKKIVERHGGRLGVVSELGVGSAFYFTLGAVGGAHPTGVS
ncbi:MAG: hypothetical protein RLZZ511_3358 [Cyanobacteriota bacterium]